MDLTRFWPTLIPLLGVLIESSSGAVAPWLAAHPTVALLVVTLVTALANLTRSPRR